VSILSKKISAFSAVKKSDFLVIFLLTLFNITLKYTYISQQANINRQQAIDIAENRTNRPALNRLLP